MSIHAHAQELVQLLADRRAAGARSNPAPVWADLTRHLAGDRAAAATLLPTYFTVPWRRSARMPGGWSCC